MQHNTIWCLGQACHHDMVWRLNRRSKKRPKRESETEYNTSRASGTREEKSRKKKEKKNKEKTSIYWKKRRKKRNRPATKNKKKKKKRREKHSKGCK